MIRILRPAVAALGLPIAIFAAMPAATVHADFVVGLATIKADDPNPPPTGVTDVQTVVNQSSSSRSFANVYAYDANGLPANVRTVGVSVIQLYDLATNTFANVKYQGKDVVVAFAIDGQIIVNSGTESTALFTSGRLGLYAIDTSDVYGAGPGPDKIKLDADDPRTWGVVNQAKTGLIDPIAVYSLKPQERILEGLNDQDTPQYGELMAAADVNTSTVDTGSGKQTTGNLLWKELDPYNTNHFIDVTYPSAPAGTTIDAEGIWSLFTQTILTGNNVTVTSPQVPFLNQIAKDLGGYNDFGWATGIGTVPGDAQKFYNDLSTFDHVANFNNEHYDQQNIGANRPGIEVFTSVVPEPSSFVLAAIGIVGTGFAGWRRRKARATSSR